MVQVGSVVRVGSKVGTVDYIGPTGLALVVFEDGSEAVHPRAKLALA